MPTVKDLRREAARWLCRPEEVIHGYIRALREAGMVPEGGEGGRGRSAEVGPDHVLNLVFGVLSMVPAGTRLAAAAEDLAKMPPRALVRVWQPAGGGCAQIDRIADFADAASAPTARDLLRYAIAVARSPAGAPFEVVGLAYGVSGGMRSVTFIYSSKLDDGTRLTEHLIFSHDAIPTPSDERNSPLGDVRTIGGRIVDEIARFLGPLTKEESDAQASYVKGYVMAAPAPGATVAAEAAAVA